jgi:D-3-phosphoglycerate dehydrogenase
MPDQVKVLIADKMDPKAAAIFRDRGIHVDEKPGLTPDELKGIIGDYDGLAVRSSTRVNAAAMDSALPRLKVIGRAGIGVDTIDVPAASARGIVVMNPPFGTKVPTTEDAI